jgi:hypothetical protein
MISSVEEREAIGRRLAKASWYQRYVLDIGARKAVVPGVILEHALYPRNWRQT